MRMILAMLTDRIRDTLGRNLDAAQVVLLMVLVCDRSAPLDQPGHDIGAGNAELTGLLTAPHSRG